MVKTDFTSGVHAGRTLEKASTIEASEGARFPDIQLTSSAFDLVPTILGLANINVPELVREISDKNLLKEGTLFSEKYASFLHKASDEGLEFLPSEFEPGSKPLFLGRDISRVILFQESAAKLIERGNFAVTITSRDRLVDIEVKNTKTSLKSSCEVDDAQPIILEQLQSLVRELISRNRYDG